jgi:hypothetical protein
MNQNSPLVSLLYTKIENNEAKRKDSHFKGGKNRAEFSHSDLVQYIKKLYSLSEQ